MENAFPGTSINISTGLLVCLAGILWGLVPGCGTSGKHSNPGIEFIKADGDLLEKKKSLILVLGFSDFSCGLCFQDYMMLSHSVSGAHIPEGDFRTYFRQEGRELKIASQLAKEWADIQDIHYPVGVLPDSLSIGELHTGPRIFLFEYGEVVKVDSLPLGPERMDKLLAGLSEK